MMYLTYILFLKNYPINFCGSMHLNVILSRNLLKPFCHVVQCIGSLREKLKSLSESWLFFHRSKG